MSNIKNRKESGFTIIEVLIVLAIAGLIMLIVFLAVPALQRNSRNTQIKNDASNVAGTISEFVSNNEGTLPTAVAKTGSTVNATGAAGSATATGKVNGSIALSTGTAAPTTLAANTVQVVFGVNCAGTASTRAAAIFYSIESSTSTAVKCIDA